MEKRTTIKYILTSRPVFLFLFPAFFVFNGFTRNYDSVPPVDALLLGLEYVGVTLVLVAVFWLFFRDLIKASLAALLIMAFQFFYGYIQDAIRDHFPDSILLRYRFVIPLTVVLFITVFIWLKRRKDSLITVVRYLNIIFLLFIFIDVGRLVIKMPEVRRGRIFHPAEEGMHICDTCSRPDVYFIIPDQYTGNTALKEVFHFDNSAFQNELKLRGFHISEKSSSNYNLTPFSVASTLDMDFVALKKGKQNYGTVGYSYKVIRNSRVLKFFLASGYRFYNCSIFDFDGAPSHKYKAFLPYGINLITGQTFISRIMDDFQTDILKGRFGKTLQNDLAYENLHFNDNIMSLTVKIAKEPSRAPKFVYTHLIMPHYPYYFDSKGHPFPVEKLSGLKQTNTSDYVEYLGYTNKKLLNLVDQILASSSRKPIIIILGDHGFRHPKKNVDRKYDFMNLNAVYFPNNNYHLFYDSISNVNQFRVILNTWFQQRLPLLRDSTTNVWD